MKHDPYKEIFEELGISDSGDTDYNDSLVQASAVKKAIRKHTIPKSEIKKWVESVYEEELGCGDKITKCFCSSEQEHNWNSILEDRLQALDDLLNKKL